MVDLKSESFPFCALPDVKNVSCLMPAAAACLPLCVCVCLFVSICECGVLKDSHTCLCVCV